MVGVCFFSFFNPRYYVSGHIRCKFEYKGVKTEAVQRTVKFCVVSLYGEVFSSLYSSLKLYSQLESWANLDAAICLTTTQALHQETMITFALLCRYSFLCAITTINLLWIRFQHIFYDVSLRIYLAWDRQWNWAVRIR
jgi:hypothetical protein